MAMLNLRIVAPTGLTDDVIEILEQEPCVSSVAVVRAAVIRPTGDLVFADVAREAANDIISRLRALGLHRDGTIEIQPVSTWLSSSGFTAECGKLRAAARTPLYGPKSRSSPMKKPSSIGPT